MRVGRTKRQDVRTKEFDWRRICLDLLDLDYLERFVYHGSEPVCRREDGLARLGIQMATSCKSLRAREEQEERERGRDCCFNATQTFTRGLLSISAASPWLFQQRHYTRIRLPRVLMQQKRQYNNDLPCERYLPMKAKSFAPHY
jgi:hypothetical protein